MPRQPGFASHFWGVPRRSQPESRETFAEIVDRYRGPIHLLSYRMTGSFEDAIQLGYDTLLTGWRLRHSAPNDVDGWLTAMAVRAGVEHARRHRPSSSAERPPESCIPRSDVTWLQPYPDHLLPDDVDRDTIGLPFIAATQSLTPRDRATLVLADIEDWPLSRVAGALRMPNADAEPRLARARATVRTGWTPTTATAASDDGDDVVGRLIDAYLVADVDRIDDLLRDDVLVTMPPLPFSFEGRTAVVGLLRQIFRTTDANGHGVRRCVPTRANRRPAFAVYVQPRRGASFAGHGVVVARSEAGRLAELTVFEPHLLPTFGLPTQL